MNGGNNNQTATALYQGAADGNVFLLFLQNNTVQLPKNVKTFSQIAAYAKSNGSTLIQASSGHPIYYKASGDSKWLINKTQTEYLLVAMMNTAGMEASCYDIQTQKGGRSEEHTSNSSHGGISRMPSSA